MSQPRLEAMAPPGDMVYRTPATLPTELVQHTSIFFEEKLYTQALRLLVNTLASGTYASKKAIIPWPDHLALAATFLVHPTTTTRAKTSEEKEAPDVALRLLRLITTLVTPKDARLDLAFSFKRYQTSRSGLRRHTDGEVDGKSRHGESSPFRLEIAEEDSLWSRAQDFWHVVGWAFNCSVLHPERWERWQLWLEFMCGVVEDDWTERERESQCQPVNEETPTETLKRKGKGPNATNHDGLAIFRESLIFQYICGVSAVGQVRRLFRAIFADGNSASVNEFRQIFNREISRVHSDKHAENPRKRDREVNIDREEYGDYLSEDESDDEPNGMVDQEVTQSRSMSPGIVPKGRRSKRTRRGTRSAIGLSSTDGTVGADQTSTQQADVSSMGGIVSLGLRKRLLDILLRVSMRLPKDFVGTDELFQLFIENIRHQPLPIFQAFVSPYVLPQFSNAAQSTLCELLLFNMRESSAPGTDEGNLTQDKLEECFLPYAAANASVVNNTKISILLEACIVLLAKSNMLSVTDDFKDAVETGILRRAERAQDEIRRSQSSRQQEPIEWCWLVESGERLSYLVELLQPA